jgi:hypothetical protein
VDLAACAQLTCQMVATALAVPVEGIERCCTVVQTLVQPPPTRTEWRTG